MGGSLGKILGNGCRWCYGIAAESVHQPGEDGKRGVIAVQDGFFTLSSSVQFVFWNVSEVKLKKLFGIEPLPLFLPV